MRGSNNLGDSRPCQTRLQRQAGASRQANILSLSVTHNKSPFRKNRKITKKGRKPGQARNIKRTTIFLQRTFSRLKKKKKIQILQTCLEKKGPTQKEKYRLANDNAFLITMLEEGERGKRKTAREGISWGIINTMVAPCLSGETPGG